MILIHSFAIVRSGLVLDTKMKNKLLTIIFSAVFLCGIAHTTVAQNVDVRVSAREAYVGMPIVLQLAIQNASDYEEPVLPEIDGCDLRTAGSPSQSSQVTIINGRRRESRSVTMQYLITPRRAGKFEIPSMTINVDGRDQKTRPISFVATKSETGDLLFVEIEGGKDKVFVGQPLDLTLKIWVKPLVDRKNDIKLSEADMWQRISEQTSWGSFTQRLKELAENNQRPAGETVLRDDGHGNEREYYLYEITATVYPKRAGEIDGSDVQIVVNYPTGLGKSRDPFAGMFRDSPFGRSSISSRMQQMMGDDFFGGSPFEGSPFGNRLSVTSSRPIVGQAAVDSTQVVSVPSEGRPADYRGAVGRYQVVTQATPTAVTAGDPITLNIGVFGTGPMELVQAPPLSELPSLTADFKVEDQLLAGFVKDETKVFPTTIRPRREGITQIPAIPFSFFDPETEAFHTVMSDPISITVEKAESLALDAIVANSRRSKSQESESAMALKTIEPNFTNDNSTGILMSQSSAATSQWWWPLVSVPPFVWLGTLLVCNREAIAGILPNFRPSLVQCLNSISRAKDRSQLDAAINRFVSRRTKQTGQAGQSGQSELTNQSTVGTLRSNGLYNVASEVESFFQSSEHSAFSGAGEESFAEAQNRARALVDKIESGLKSMSKSQVRRSTRRKTGSNSKARVRRVDRAVRQAVMLLVVGLFAFAVTGNALAKDAPLLPKVANGSEVSEVSLLSLSKSQQQTILNEAGGLYSRADAVAETDAAEANDLFTSAAAKYQLLVDSGICNCRLYMNLGNAYLKSNQLGHAIVNYERAKSIDPTNRQLVVNLELANSLVKGDSENVTQPNVTQPKGSPSLSSIVGQLHEANNAVVGVVGRKLIVWILVISSIIFWGLLIVSAVRRTLNRYPLKRIAIAPLMMLILTATSYGLSNLAAASGYNGIIVANDVTLHSGDGEQFDEVATIETAQGHRVKYLDRRGDWVKIETCLEQSGWVRSREIEATNPI